MPDPGSWNDAGVIERANHVSELADRRPLLRGDLGPERRCCLAITTAWSLLGSQWLGAEAQSVKTWGACQYPAGCAVIRAASLVMARAEGLVVCVMAPDPHAASAAQAWAAAARLVTIWPHLTIAWADWYEVPDHLVVFVDADVVLHFAAAEGPVMESADGEQPSSWAELEALDLESRFQRIDWRRHFGAPAGEPEVTAKGAIYATIAAILASSPADEWAARPAKMVFDTDHPLDDPNAVFRLIGGFPSLMSTVQWYASQVSAGMRRATAGRTVGWHDPLWQITRGDAVAVVLDEAGRVHLPRISTEDDNLADLLELVADGADWVAGGFSFDVLAALRQLDGDVEGLAALLLPGARRAFGPRRAWSPANPDRANTAPRRLQG